ncbi:MAG: RodZ domain-containing protein [Desulfatiglans sp.]|jgi:cytoskeleton protein RodZ|nr:DUF4115 domain-containing protein [Thermodesulfobacteriota bacterium]MEE4351958.1 RodZ domain-containing protein [Desulfatiglans sp.]
MSEHISDESGLEEEKEVSPQGIGFGAFLRNEREKQGLDYSQISEKTKLRPLILQAIENEDWDKLPAPVFVTGFIRSYARAVGADENKVLALYQSSCPIEATPLKPISRPSRSRKTLPIVLLFVTLCIFLGYFSFRELLHTQTSPDKSTVEEPIEKKGQEIGKRGEKAPKKEDEPKPLPTLKSSDQDEPPKVDQQDRVSPSTDALSETEQKRLFPLEEISVPKVKPPPVAESPTHTLTAHVTSETWLKISIDNEPPREYTFPPGSELTWKARHGFDLTIGNAGGIHFELNRKPLENLGNLGQVIRLRLPKDYRGMISEQ